MSKAPRAADYATVAGEYDRRYTRHSYEGVAEALLTFLDPLDGLRVLEVGCGTGHWLLRVPSKRARVMVGVDPSGPMLDVAGAKGLKGAVVRAFGEKLPWGTGVFDRVYCINALHHFTDPAVFLGEARRVLTNGGGLFTVGLDPHTGRDEWWVYDYFPGAADVDRARYLPTNTIRAMMIAVGFDRSSTAEVERFTTPRAFRVAAAAGSVDRSSTSQLMVISDEEYEHGLHAMEAEQETLGEKDLMLNANLTLYATTGWVRE